jgi:hypothetical protein
MQIETLRDVLHWTRKFHTQLQEGLTHSSEINKDERARLLLVYLSDHENKLTKVLDGFERTASLNALDTWCYEYVDKNPVQSHHASEANFAEMNSAEISTEISTLHEQVIELYRNILARANSESSRKLLSDLLDIETHMAMQATQNANNLRDL